MRAALSVELDRRHLEGHDRAVSLHAHRYALPYHLADHHSLEVADALDRLAVDLDDHVAGANACGRGGTCLLYTSPSPRD